MLAETAFPRALPVAFPPYSTVIVVMLCEMVVFRREFAQRLGKARIPNSELVAMFPIVLGQPSLNASAFEYSLIETPLLNARRRCLATTGSTS